MREIKFDFNNMFSFSVGNKHGVTPGELKSLAKTIFKAHKHLASVISSNVNRVNLSLEWAKLPFQGREVIQKIQRLGSEIAGKYENALFLGIGGSYLGLKAAQDALAPVYYNEFSNLRKGSPRIYFEGNNLDPDTIGVLLKNLDPEKTFVVVISKSGETTETKAAFAVVEPWLKKANPKHYGRQIIAITDPESGSLRKKADEEQAKDPLSFRNLPLLKGVGGRFSEFNMGLLHLAIIGIKIQEVLDGAAYMAERCSSPDIFKNPAYMYAALQYILDRKKGKSIAMMMPFSETLKSTADWYTQLLGESLGKKYARKIEVNNEGVEFWRMDKEYVVNSGRTPVAARGTNDLHSIQQNNIEGRNNKAVTFIKVEKFRHDIKVAGAAGILSNKLYSHLLALAEEATEWALTRESRPNMTIIMPQVSPYHWGALLFFFEMAVAFEGELLNINAFDQPGVEGYKNYMYYKLQKSGLDKKTENEIKNSPLLKKPRFII